MAPDELERQTRCHFSLITSLQTNRYAYFRVSGHHDILFTMLRLILGNFRMYMEKNAEVKDLTDTLFKDFEGAPLGQYWVSFMEMVELLTQNIHALRTSNWTEFKSSLKLMLPWMQIYVSMVGIFLISLQCLITFLSNRLLSWKMVCLHSQ